jgi:hypothetical protein
MLHKYFTNYYKFVLPIFLIILFFAVYLHPTDELFIDLGGHLLRGRLLAQTHIVSTTNTFSYTYPSFYVINLEWLTELIFYLVSVFSGINGLIILTTAAALISVTIIYKFATNRLPTVLVSYLAISYLLLLAPRADVLPELFSYLFIAIFMVILYKFREKYTNLIWLLIPLQLLWINMHIYFVIGILLTGLFLLEGLILFRKKEEGKYVKSLAIVFIASWIVSLLNPFGLSGLLFPFTFSPKFGFSVQENNSVFQTNYGETFFSFFFGQNVSIQIFDVLAVLLILAIILQYKKIRLIDAIISIVAIVGGVLAIRDLSIFVFATFIPAAFILSSLLKKYQRLQNTKLRKVLLLSFPVLTVALSFWTASQLGGPGLGTKHGYENAVDFYLDNHLSGPIFNNFNIGTYLEYRFYPQERVFVDTNPIAYPVSFFQSVYTPMLKNLNNFQQAEDKYKFNTIIYGYTNGIPLDVGFLRYLLQSKEWKVIYIDDSTIIFIKNIKPNESIIQEYAISDNNFRIPEDDTSFNNLINLAQFLDLMRWKKAYIEVNQKMYVMDPNNCEVLYNLISLLGPSNPSASIYLNSFYINRCRK